MYDTREAGEKREKTLARPAGSIPKLRKLLATSWAKCTWMMRTIPTQRWNNRATVHHIYHKPPIT